MSTVIYPATEVYYPDSGGQSMAESDFQREPLIYAVESLRIHFHQRKDVYVSGNMFLYYEEGNPKAVVAPDVFVVIGAPNRDRYSYKLWQEPKGPDFVLEITSKSTRTEDRGPKRGIYALLGVSEYWQYDPTGDYLKPPLQALRLVDENYWPMPAETLPDGSTVIHSAVLGLDLRLEDGILRCYDPLTGQKLLVMRKLSKPPSAGRAGPAGSGRAGLPGKRQNDRHWRHAWPNSNSACAMRKINSQTA